MMGRIGLFARLLCLLGCLSASGCTSRRDLGDTCLFNDDCAEGLLCAGGYCRAVCRTDRDCIATWRCVSGVAGQSACVPPDAEGLCIDSLSCPADARCVMRGVLGGVCRWNCAASRDTCSARRSGACDLRTASCSVSVTARELPELARLKPERDGGLDDAPIAVDAPMDRAAPEDLPGDVVDAGDVTDAADASDASDAADASDTSTDVSPDAPADVVCLATSAGNCDGLAANGCETDLATSITHCGRCGNACPTFEGTVGPRCASGECSPGECAANRASCDGVAANGCETDLRSAAAHCGRCGNRCSDASHVASASCAAGACRVEMCDGGWGDCDGDPTNGCEARLTEDDANCGACGNRCSTSGRVCEAVDGGIGRCVDGRFPVPTSLGAATEALAPSADAGVVVVSAGQHHYTRVTIPAGVTVHTDSTGVLEIWSDGDVVIDGTIDVSGGRGGEGTYAGSTMYPSGGGGGTGTAVAGLQGGPRCAPAGVGGSRGTAGGNAAGVFDDCGRGGNLGGGAGGYAGGGGGGGVAGGGGAGGYNSDPGGVAGGLGGGESLRAAGGAVAFAGGEGGRASTVGTDPYYAGHPGTARGACGPATSGAGGGGSIGVEAAQDLTLSAVPSTFYTGSGGGGGGAGNYFGSGGGGGGGALRVVSRTRIAVRGQLRADGGDGGDGAGPGGGGSGGVIVLYAPSVWFEGGSTISANFGHGGARRYPGAGYCVTGGQGDGGLGRIRIFARCSTSRFDGTMVPPPIAGLVVGVAGCRLDVPSATPGRAFISNYP